MRTITLATLLMALIFGIALPAAAQDLGDRIGNAKDQVEDIRNAVDDEDSDSDKQNDDDSDSDKDDDKKD